MAYTPINLGAYQSAYAGALAGMAVNGWITNTLSTNYLNVSIVAGAYAQAFDQMWNSAVLLTQMQSDLIVNASRDQMTERAVGNLTANGAWLVSSAWNDAARAVATLVLEADAYFATQGILQGQAPGTEIVWQPNGPGIGPNIVVAEADVQSMIDDTNALQFGFGKFVIDGSFNGGIVDINASIDLKTSFDVELKNVDTINCNSAVSATGVFTDIRESLTADKQVLARRTVNGAGISLLRLNPGNATTGIYVKNIIWDATTVGVTTPGWMVNALNSSLFRIWMEDCSLQPNLTVARAADRLLSYSPVPDGGNALQIFWYGPNAAQITAGNANFMVGASGGYNTSFTYGTFGGALISLAGISWAAAAPVVTSRQP